MSFTFGTPVENTFSSSTPSVAIPSVPAGATIVVFFNFNDGGLTVTISGVSDGVSYIQAGSNVTSGGTNFSGAIFYLQNAGSGTHTVTVTFSSGTTGYLVGFWVNGVSATPFDTSTGQYSNFAGTGADAVSSGSMTTGTAGDAVIGLFNTVSGTVGTLSVGTTPNTFTTLSFSTAGALGEYFVQSAAGAIAATATNTQNDGVIAMAIALKAAAVASGATLMGQILS